MRLLFSYIDSLFNWYDNLRVLALNGREFALFSFFDSIKILNLFAYDNPYPKKKAKKEGSSKRIMIE